jgi:Zn-dependent protease with chaperone function
MSTFRTTFPGISPNAWEHPADRVALNALRKAAGLDTAIRFFLGNTDERSLRLVYLASAVRVTPRQYARVHAATEDVCEVLGVAKMPDVFVAQNPFFNAGAVGWDNPFIVVNSSAVATLTDEELRDLMGHEMGHILSGHVLYKTMLQMLLMLAPLANALPLTNVVLLGLIAALREWDRKSELSADRAGLLSVQDPNVSIGVLMKIAGGADLKQMDVEEFIRQAEEYNNANTVLDTTYKLLNLVWRTHPFAVVRVAELLKWSKSAEYEAILKGNYPTGRTDMKDDFAKAAEGYRQDWKENAQPFQNVFSEVEKTMKDATDEARKLWDNFFNKK